MSQRSHLDSQIDFRHPYPSTCQSPQHYFLSVHPLPPFTVTCHRKEKQAEDHAIHHRFHRAHHPFHPASDTGGHAPRVGPLMANTTMVTHRGLDGDSLNDPEDTMRLSMQFYPDCYTFSGPRNFSGSFSSSFPGDFLTPFPMIPIPRSMTSAIMSAAKLHPAPNQNAACRPNSNASVGAFPAFSPFVW